jgi:DNA-binding NtrC family response regulator
MLFLKTEGTSLGVADWTAQLAPAPPGTEPDLFSEAANAMWRAISQRGISYARACEEIERRVLETAISVQGATRRQVAERLRTSERTLYYKMRAHGLRHPGGMHS